MPRGARANGLSPREACLMIGGVLFLALVATLSFSLGQQACLRRTGGGGGDASFLFGAGGRGDRSASATDKGDGKAPAMHFAADGRLHFVSTPFCLDVPQASTVALYFCHSEAVSPQRWEYTAQRQLLNTFDLLCLAAEDVKGSGVPWLSLRPCAAAPSQQWDFLRAGAFSPVGQLKHAGSGLCLTPAKKPSSKTGHALFEPTLAPCTQHGAGCQQLLHAAFELSTIPAAYTDQFAYDSAEAHAQAVSQAGRPPARLFCWVMSNPDFLDVQARAVLETWGRGCDEIVFATSRAPSAGSPLPYMLLDIGGANEDRQLLWKKSQQAWRRAFHERGEHFDWFLRADDDSFIDVPNLRALLAAHDRSEAVYLGRLYHAEGTSFYSGGSGTVLSHEALRRFVFASESVVSPVDTFADDLELGVTLHHLGVSARHFHDADGRELFFGLGVETERFTFRADDPDNWLWSYDPDFREGAGCCSSRWVATHYVDWRSMYALYDAVALECEARGTLPWFFQ